jgi:hypothetical protein
MRKIKESPYVTDEVEGIEAATGLVTREMKKKKAKDAPALQKALEIAEEIEIPANSLVRGDVAADAEEIIKATEDVQEFAISEASNLMMVVSATEDVQKDISTEAEAAADKEGNPDLSHTNDVVEIESYSNSSSPSQSTSSSST